MVRVGRDLKDHLVPTPLPWAVTSSTRSGCSEARQRENLVSLRMTHEKSCLHVKQKPKNRNLAEFFSAPGTQKPESWLHIGYLFHLRSRATFYKCLLKSTYLLKPKENKWWRFSQRLLWPYQGQIFPVSLHKHQWEINCTWSVIYHRNLMQLLDIYGEVSLSTMTTETAQRDYPY